MTLTPLFQIDGQPLYAPDADVTPSYADLDSSDSGRDASGVMHREVVREKVATWPFSYASLTDAQYAYLVGLFSGKATFAFTHPRAGSSTETVPPPATAATTASPGAAPGTAPGAI